MSRLMLRLSSTAIHPPPTMSSMPTNRPIVTPVKLPSESRIACAYDSVDLADAYSIQLPVGTTANPELLARFIVAQQAPWVGALMKMRDIPVAGLGLKTARHLTSLGSDSQTNRVGIFRVFSTSETEVVLGEDDRHLDFRLSFLRSERTAQAGTHDLVVSTVVHCHNRLGRFYIFLIAPFHRLIIQSSLRRAARIGWP
jgi:hypothetical protein